MIGTPANRQILAEARCARSRGRGGGSRRSRSSPSARQRRRPQTAPAMHARALLDQRRGGHRSAELPAAGSRARSARRIAALPDANLALISVPGDFAAAEATKALARGLNAMIFSDNVPLEPTRSR